MSVSPRPCSWVSIFDFRDSYVGSVNHCVRGLFYQNAQKENMTYNYNLPTPVGAYLGPHEMYPSTFPYQMMYPNQQQCVKPSYNYSMEQREMYLPKTLPMEEPPPASHPATLLDARSFGGQNTPESFEVWNNSFVRDMKSIPKFDSLLDIDRLEQICYDDVDNCTISKNTEMQKDNRTRKTKEEKIVQPSMKDMLNGSFDRTPEKAAVGYGSFERREKNAVGYSNYERTPEKTTMGSKITSKLPSSSSPNGARPKEIIPVNGKPVKQAGNSVKVCIFKYGKCS